VGRGEDFVKHEREWAWRFIYYIIEWNVRYDLDKSVEWDYITTIIFGSLSYYSMSRLFEISFVPKILLYVQRVLYKRHIRACVQ
jgi:hypothetical protein